MILEITKLSELLEIALADLEAVKNQPGYIVDMGEFYAQYSDGCHFCLAGACLINQDLLSTWRGCDNDYEELKHRMYAISDLCLGDVSGACKGMDVAGDYDLNRQAVPYGSPGWNDYIHTLLNDLKEAGL